LFTKRERTEKLNMNMLRSWKITYNTINDTWATFWRPLDGEWEPMGFHSQNLTIDELFHRIYKFQLEAERERAFEIGGESGLNDCRQMQRERGFPTLPTTERG
jgi:hypothetical protein